MLNISQLRLHLAEDGVQATSIARAELTTRVAEYKELGEDARAIVFGSHRKPQAVIVPIDMFNQLLDLAEGIATTPKAAPQSKKDYVEPAVAEAVQEPKQLAGSDLHIGASTQELLDEIMKKWKI